MDEHASGPSEAGVAPEIAARLRAQSDLDLPPERWPAVAAQLAPLVASIRRLEELALAEVEPGPLWRADVEGAP